MYGRDAFEVVKLRDLSRPPRACVQHNMEAQQPLLLRSSFEHQRLYGLTKDALSTV